MAMFNLKKTTLPAFVLAAVFANSLCIPVPAELLTFPKKPVDSKLLSFKKAIDALHKKALTSKKPWREEALRKKISSKYLRLEKSYLKVKNPKLRALALSQLALLYAELAWVDKIRPIAAAVKKLDPELAGRLGHFEESKHFLVRIVGADPKWATAALKLAEAAREGYLNLFGFRVISKVPGKKIRILIHLDPTNQTRLYFHPTPLYHGEIRYEISDEKYLTLKGRNRLVYGFCHELGHILAMWGDHFKRIEDDKHQWAHYTGCMIVEEVYKNLGNQPWPTWTSFQRQACGVPWLLKQVDGHESGLGSKDAILTLFHTVGKEFGTKIYGQAWLWLEKKKRFRKINNVRYLWMKDLQEALINIVPKNKARRVNEIFRRG